MPSSKIDKDKKVAESRPPLSVHEDVTAHP